MAVDFAINQSELYRFSQLRAKGNNPKDSTFSLAFGDSIYTAFGHITLIDRAVDPQTGTIKIRLTFPNEHKILKAGMTGVVRVLNSANQTVIIPYKAVTEQLGEFFVYVINDSNKATQTKIITGRQIGNKIIVRNGLQAGQKIAVQGVQNLKEGAAVKPIADTTQKSKYNFLTSEHRK